MKVMVDLEPRDVWRIQERAERLGITPGEALRDELGTRRAVRDLREAIRERVKAGMCDADIAAELGNAPGYIAKVRRGMELPANRRYHPPAPAAVEVGDRFIDKDIRYPGRLVEVVETGLKGGKVRVRIVQHPDPSIAGRLQTIASDSLRAHYERKTA